MCCVAKDRMVPFTDPTLVKGDKEIVESFILSPGLCSDSEEEEEEDDVLNFSCHGKDFKTMFKHKGYDKFAVKRRKLGTNLKTLDIELSALNFETSEATDCSVSSSSPSERQRKSPRRQKNMTLVNSKSTHQ